MKRTKFIYTVDTNSIDYDTMCNMTINGVDAIGVSFNMSVKEREEVLRTIKKVRTNTKKNIALCWEMKGPEFRTGALVSDYVELIKGLQITIVKEKIIGDAKRISVNHPEALDTINIGDVLLLDDDKMKLKVIEKNAKYITCSILIGGRLGNHKSINVVGVKLNIPYVSNSDREDLKYACNNGGEYLIIPEISSKIDVIAVKQLLKKYEREDLQVICKIQNKFVVKELEDILSICDGVILDRKKLSTEASLEKLSILQKYVGQLCREHNKVFVVVPEELETSVIVNSILSGVDAISFSNILESVEKIMEFSDITIATESYAKFDYVLEGIGDNSLTSVMLQSIIDVCNKVDVAAISTYTRNGNVSRMISNLKPRTVIFTLCPTEKVCRSLALNYGVYASCLKSNTFDGDYVKLTSSILELEKGDNILVTGSFPLGSKNDEKINFMEIEEI